MIKKLVRRATHWYVEPRWTAQREFDAETARFATESVLTARRTYLELRDARYEIDALRRDLREQTRAWVSRHSEQVRSLDEAQTRFDACFDGVIARCGQLDVALADALATLDEQRALIDRLSAELAPVTEVAMLREELAGVMERLGVASAYGGSFDYVAFEDRFRGESSALSALQADYVTKFPPPAEPGAIVDVGCGRGEMLEVLRDAGHEIVGIDLDENMVEVCRTKGLPVLRGDGSSWLELCDRGTLKGIFSAQVIEHLLTPEIERFLHASLVALRPGGVLVMETINPRSLHALGNHFFADVSHVRPIHPETLRFMCEQTGFADVALVELSPHPAVASANELGHEPVEDAVRQLVSSVFGFQDYAIVATKGS